MQMLDTTPFESFLKAASETAAASFANGPEKALALPATTGDNLLAEEQATTVSGLGASDTRTKQRIRQIVNDAFFKAADTISDGMCYQFMAIQEMGELLVMYRNLYGTVKDSTDPSKKCNGS